MDDVLSVWGTENPGNDLSGEYLLNRWEYQMDSKTFVPVSQAELIELAERCLRTNSYHALRNIACNYLNGVLILRGSVETYYLKQVAQAAVSRLEGVERLDNQIRVVTPVSRSRRD